MIVFNRDKGYFLGSSFHSPLLLRAHHFPFFSSQSIYIERKAFLSAHYLFSSDCPQHTPISLPSLYQHIRSFLPSIYRYGWLPRVLSIQHVPFLMLTMVQQLQVVPSTGVGAAGHICTVQYLYVGLFLRSPWRKYYIDLRFSIVSFPWFDALLAARLKYRPVTSWHIPIPGDFKMKSAL